jgi:hypothetical protein
MQGSLNFTNTDWTTILQKKPVNPPSLATQFVFQPRLILRTQAQMVVHFKAISMG